MTWVLGFHGGVKPRDVDNSAVGYSSHDAAAVLLHDGRIVAAIEEERLTRVKHANSFPAQAIQFCLDYAHICLDDVDFVTTDVLESTLDAFLQFEALVHPDMPFTTGRLWLDALFQKEFGVGIASKLRFCQHHMAHLYGAVLCSGFEQCLAVSLDGEGDGLSGAVATYSENGFEMLKTYSAAQSLGNFYTSAIALLGYRRFDEYKVMGLAPYGDASVFAEMFQSCYSLLPDGEVSFVSDADKLYQAARLGLLAHVRRAGQPFTQAHKDFAAGLQSALEEIAFHILSHFRKVSGQSRLALSGGVAHNCTLNGKLLYSGLFEEIFVQPAAHDAGNALGAALAITAGECGMPRPHKLESLFLGADGHEIEASLRAWSSFLDWEKVEDVVGRTADVLAEGFVIGWYQGRSEFGPRALGNRSILADPRPAENKERINAMVKKREGYRPFAPSVAEERVRDYFEVPDSTESFPFMIFVLRVLPEMRERLAAITHVDGTARVQTVSRETNPKYYDLIAEFGKRTGVSMLLNTSFNNHAEPIVDSVEDAIACYLTTGLDYLVLGDYLIKKKSEDVRHQQFVSLHCTLSSSRKLVQYSAGSSGSTETKFAIESIYGSYFASPRVAISEEVYRILVLNDQELNLTERCTHLQIFSLSALERVRTEMAYLWHQRAIRLHPKE